jgi:antirestriction protein ArdC
MNPQHDIYSKVTQMVLEGLEKGVIPWRKPFITPRPANLLTHKPYRGINFLLLTFAQRLHSYSSHCWATFAQCKQLEGYVKRGSKGFKVVFFNFYENRVNIDQVDDEQRLKRWTEKERAQGFRIHRIPYLKEYTVFNVDQMQVDPVVVPRIETLKVDPIAEAEKIIKSYKDIPPIKTMTGRAYYNPVTDEIRMPPTEHFDSMESYYSTLFHEMIHSTEHPDRLKRADRVEGCFTHSDYSYEELVAEIGASMLNGLAGILDRTIENSQGYINGWIRTLKNDKKMIIMAAGQAQKAVDYITGRREANEEVA